MASIHDCYPDWETFESSAHLKKKKKNNKNANNFMNYEGFYPLEGFSNQAQELEQKQNKSSSNALNITYGAPSEYFPAQYNENTYQQNTVSNTKRQNNRNNANVMKEANNVVIEEELAKNKVMDNELRTEIEVIRNMLSSIMDRLEKKDDEYTPAETTTHDMILFVIFGLFVIFALEGTAKIIANLAKRGKF
jgi:hypothetical protein